MSVEISCTCGALQGTLARRAGLHRGLCYCRDCQAFAHFLGRADEILDANGGSEVLQTSPSHVAFTQGAEHLACMRLARGGLRRWYAGCCNTPIGNTPRHHKLAFVGLLRQCLQDGEGGDLDERLGPIRMRVFTKEGKWQEPPPEQGVTLTMAKFVTKLLLARITGSYRKTPFFSPSGEPVVKATVLEEAERQALYENL